MGAIGGSAGATSAAILGTSGDVEEPEGNIGDFPGHSTKFKFRTF